MKRVFVTGGTGFVGGELTRLLVSKGSQVGLLVRDAEKARRAIDVFAEVEFFVGDLFDNTSVSCALSEFRPDTLIHLGWAGVSSQDRDDAIQLLNHASTIQLVKSAIQCGITTFVGLGSQAEYGLKGGIINEREVCNPVSLYGACKLSSGVIADQLCRVGQVRFAWIRLFSCYGPNDTPTSMIPTVIENLLRSECPKLTEAKQIWDYLYVADAASAIACVADSTSAKGIFNLGSGVGVPVRQVVKQLRDLIDRNLPLGFGQVAYGPQSLMHLQADISNLENIGWKPKTALEIGLSQTVNWHRNRIRT